MLLPVQDVFPEQHPGCFSEALENSKPLRRTSCLFSFDRYVRLKFEWDFHWIFFNRIEDMFIKHNLFILLDHRTDSQYGADELRQ